MPEIAAADPQVRNIPAGGGNLYSGPASGAPVGSSANPLKAGTNQGQYGGTYSPTVVTDSNIREDTIPDITRRTQSALSPTGIIQGTAPEGSLLSANGNYVDKAGNQYTSAPGTATPGSTGQNPNPTPPAQTGSDKTNEPTDEYSAFLKSMFGDNQSTPTQGAAPANDPYLATLSTLKATADKSTQTLIAATQKQFEQRKAQLAATNAASHAGLIQALTSNGNAQYAPVLAGQALTADETSHILALSNVDAEESSAVAQLQKAQSDQDFQTMGKWLDHLDSLKKDKIAIASKLAETAATTTKAINDAKVKLADSIGKIAQDAAKNGATPEQIAAINASPDIGTAITTAGDTLKTYQGGIVGEYQYYVDQAKKAGHNPIDFNTYQTMDANRKALASGSGTKVGAVDTSFLDPKAQAALEKTNFSKYSGSAQSLASQLVNGQLAPKELSKRTSGDASYNDVLTAADMYSMAVTGKHFNVAQADRDYNFAQRPQTQDTLNYLGSLVGSVDESGAPSGGNLNELVALSNDIGRTRFPAINDVAAWARYSAGDPKIAAFQATATEVADQVAKILQGGGGSGTSDAKLQQAANLFNTGFSKEQMIATVNALKPLLANRAKSMIKDNAYLSDYADQFGIDQKIPGKAPTTGDSLIADENVAKTQVTSAATGNPVVQKTVYDLLSKPDPALGRIMTYSEILQYLQATNSVK